MESNRVLMEKFIQQNNIAHFHEQLKIETDPVKRETLQRLLAEEETNLEDHAKEAIGRGL